MIPQIINANKPYRCWTHYNVWLEKQVIGCLVLSWSDNISTAPLCPQQKQL